MNQLHDATAQYKKKIYAAENYLGSLKAFLLCIQKNKIKKITNRLPKDEGLLRKFSFQNKLM